MDHSHAGSSCTLIRSIRRSPLPVLTLDPHQRFWQGEDELPSWAGFQPRRGPYGAPGPRGTSGAITLLSVRVVDAAGLTAAQLAAYTYLRGHEPAIAAGVQHALLPEYRCGRQRAIDAAGPDPDPETWFELTGRRGPVPSERRHLELRLPEISTAAELASLCGLHSVHILAVELDGRAYVGFELGCNWDKEHGAGVLTWGDRVVAVGEAAVSFRGAAAARDASRRRGRA